MSAGTYQPTPEGAIVTRFKSQTVNYNFDVYGAGIVGDNALPLTVPIPAGSVLTNIIVTNPVRFVGPTAIGLGIVVAGDIINIRNANDYPYTAPAAMFVKLTLPITVTDTQELILTFTVNVATAGNVTFTIEWMETA